MPTLDRTLDVVISDTPTCLQCNVNPAYPGASYCLACAGGTPSRPDEAAAKAVAQRELAMRELCRRRLLPFTQRMRPDYIAGWVHIDLAARLERFIRRVEEGLSPRLIINMPPRHGKTELASKSLVAWFLGRNPTKTIIAATHSDRLALDNSRDVLDYVRDERYKSIFKTRLDKDNKGAMGWRTEDGGVYKPVGVGAGISGYGANVLLVDDPHRDKDAYSEAVRDAVHRWYKSSARTRLAPGGGIIIIQTRWVLDDLTGRVIDEEGLIEQGGVWEHVCYPAIAETDEYRLPSGIVVRGDAVPGATLLRRAGEVLHPDRYPHKLLKDAQGDPVVWQALYQQNPSAGEAAIFKNDRIIRCKSDDIPKNLIFYIAADLAVSTTDRSNDSAFVVAGVDQDDNIYIVDAVFGKWDTLELIELMISLHQQYHPDLFGIEKTHSAIALKPVLDKIIEERELTIAFDDLEHGNKDKGLRARPIQARMFQGKVIIPDDTEWAPELMKQLREFPVGKNDDLVDAIAWIGQMLDMMDKAKSTETKQGEPSSAPKSKPWRERLQTIHREGRPKRNWKSA